MGYFLNHIKLLVSIALGTVLFFVLPGSLSTLARVLVGWNGGVVLLLLWVFLWMRSRTAEQLYMKYKEEDATAIVVLVIVVCSALLSLAAIVVLLSTVKQVSGSVKALHISLAAATVITSWLLVPTMFTLHYTDEFYSASEQDRPLRFPHTPEPIFWDFVYFAFTIAVACQTADVATANVAVRKAVVAQSVIAFLFNVSIVGLAVNISASLFTA
jgi:uncharacterized membrane protein